MDASSAREIEAAVREALGLFGTSGSVVVRGRQVELHGSGAPVVIDMEQLGEQWPLLPEDMRARKAGELARRLSEAQRTVRSLAPPPARAPSLPSRAVVIPAGAVVLALVGVFFVVRLLRSTEAPPPPPAVPVESNQEAAARNARVCEAARKRIYAGASMGPFEMEGWVAELWLAKARPFGDAATADAGALSAEAIGLGAFIQQGQLVPAADAEIAAVKDGAVEIAPGFSDEDAARSPSWRAVTVRMSGGYARGYFDGAQRPRMLAMVDRMADAVGAELSAFYARCAHLSYHDAGAWFRGVGAAGAATALVYGAGFFAELPAVDRGAVAALGGAGQLDALRSAGAGLDNGTLGRLVGAHGGGISTGSGGAVSVTFPFGGLTRATSASRVVARKLGVGVGQD